MCMPNGGTVVNSGARAIGDTAQGGADALNRAGDYIGARIPGR